MLVVLLTTYTILLTTIVIHRNIQELLQGTRDIKRVGRQAVRVGVCTVSLVVAHPILNWWSDKVSFLCEEIGACVYEVECGSALRHNILHYDVTLRSRVKIL